MYSIGDPTMPKPEDRRFGDLESAEDAVVEAAIDDSVWAVWDDENGEVLALAFGGVLFTA
jgi:hypothetical protein